jgi:arylsulfatase A-like enzyme
LGNKGLDFQTAYSTRDALRVAQEGEAWHSPEALLRVFRKWLQEHHCARFYCYLHFIPPHMPYPSDKDRLAPFKGKKPPGYRSERYHPGEWDFPLPPNTQHHPPLPEWINLYDANLRYGDWAASEVLRLLREVGVQEKTIFVLTSDHGEAFGEHGFVFHDRCPYDEVARIPLLIRFPNAARTGRIGGLSQSIDILPTFCDLFGISYPEIKVQGQSLLPIIAGAQDKVHDYIFTHAYLDRDKYLVRGLDHALVLYGTDNRRELYALKSDQEQRRNVIGGNPKKAGQMVEAFRKFAQRQRWDIMYIIDPDGTYAERPRDMPGKPVPEDTKKQLEALGYL